MAHRMKTGAHADLVVHAGGEYVELRIWPEAGDEPTARVRLDLLEAEYLRRHLDKITDEMVAHQSRGRRWLTPEER